MTPIEIPEDGPIRKTTTPELGATAAVQPAPASPALLPGLPYSIEHLRKALTKISRMADEFRAKYPGLAAPPDEFLAAVMPDLEAALGNSDYARQVALRAWLGILNNEGGYNRHHGGLA